MENILKVIGLLIIAIGIVCVYDARRLTRKFFSTSDINSAVRTLKIVGYIVAILGGVLVIV